MKNKKGFSLIELLLSVTIIAVTVSMMTPVFYKQIENAQFTVCEINRREFMKSFELFKALDTEGYTLENVLDANRCPPELRDALDGLTCPEGGTFSVRDGQLVCSEHGVVGSHTIDFEDELERLVAGELFSAIYCFTTGKHCAIWPSCLGRRPPPGGTVYVSDGNMYVVTSNISLTRERRRISERTGRHRYSVLRSLHRDQRVGLQYSHRVASAADERRHLH
jgi:prepilin-type N-terminal cleavage/methylation domain-containing protein